MFYLGADIISRKYSEWTNAELSPMKRRDTSIVIQMEIYTCITPEKLKLGSYSVYHQMVNYYCHLVNGRDKTNDENDPGNPDLCSANPCGLRLAAATTATGTQTARQLCR